MSDVPFPLALRALSFRLDARLATPRQAVRESLASEISGKPSEHVGQPQRSECAKHPRESSEHVRRSAKWRRESAGGGCRIPQELADAEIIFRRARAWRPHANCPKARDCPNKGSPTSSEYYVPSAHACPATAIESGQRWPDVGSSSFETWAMLSNMVWRRRRVPIRGSWATLLDRTPRPPPNLLGPFRGPNFVPEGRAGSRRLLRATPKPPTCSTSSSPSGRNKRLCRAARTTLTRGNLSRSTRESPSTLSGCCSNCQIGA